MTTVDFHKKTRNWDFFKSGSFADSKCISIRNLNKSNSMLTLQNFNKSKLEINDISIIPSISKSKMNEATYKHPSSITNSYDFKQRIENIKRYKNCDKNNEIKFYKNSLLFNSKSNISIPKLESFSKMVKSSKLDQRITSLKSRNYLPKVVHTSVKEKRELLKQQLVQFHMNQHLQTYQI